MDRFGMTERQKGKTASRDLCVRIALACTLTLLAGLAVRGPLHDTVTTVTQRLPALQPDPAVSAQSLAVSSPWVGLYKAGLDLSETVRAFVEAPLPAVARHLSPGSPLIFHHQRKTGGSSLRIALKAAAAAANLTTFVTCYAGVSCDSYTFGNASAALYAGHLGWGERRNLARTGSLDVRTARWSTPQQRASCLTLFREPIARLESCYYYRFVNKRMAGPKAIAHPRFQCISNLTASEVRSMLVTGRSQFGSGCLAEPFRIFSGQTSEEELAEVAIHPPGSPAGAAMLALTDRKSVV